MDTLDYASMTDEELLAEKVKRNPETQSSPAPVDYSSMSDDQLISLSAERSAAAPIDQSQFYKTLSNEELLILRDSGDPGIRESLEQRYRDNKYTLATKGLTFTGDDDQDFALFRQAEMSGDLDFEFTPADLVTSFGKGLWNMAKGAAVLGGEVVSDVTFGLTTGDLTDMKGKGLNYTNRSLPTLAEGFGRNINDLRAVWAGATYLSTKYRKSNIFGDGAADQDEVLRAKFKFMKKAQAIEKDNIDWHEAITLTFGYAPDANAAEFAGEIFSPDEILGGFIAKGIAKGATKFGGAAVPKSALGGMIDRLSTEQVAAMAEHEASKVALSVAQKAGDIPAIDAARKAMAVASKDLEAVSTQLSSEMAKGAASFSRRAAAATAETFGRGVEKAGSVITSLRSKTDNPAADAALSYATNGVSIALRSGNLITRTGRDIRAAGEILRAGRATVPYFRRLAAREDVTKKVRWVSGAIDKSQLAWTGDKIIQGGVAVAPSAAISGTFGYVASGGDLEAAAESAGSGGVFGISGAAYGAWQAYSTPGARVEELMSNRVAYLQALSNRPDASGRTQRLLFERLPAHEQLMVGTFAQSHPDLAWRFDDTLGPTESGRYDKGRNEIQINPNSKNVVRDIFAHEIAHGVETHGLGATIRTQLIGSVDTGQIGEYTLLDKNGEAVLGKDGQFATTEEFQRLKESYAKLLVGDETSFGGDKAAYAAAVSARVSQLSDGYIASEIFAEHFAERALGGGMIKDLRSSPVDRIVDSALNISILKDFLGKVGLVFDSADQISGSGVFKDLRRSPTIDKLVRDWNRDRSFGVPLPEREKTDHTLSEAEIRDPKIAQKWAAAGGHIRIGTDGKPIYKTGNAPVYVTAKEADREQVELGLEIKAALDIYLAENPETDAVQLDPTTGQYRGSHLPEEVIDRIEASGRFNPYQISTLRGVSRMVKTHGMGAMVKSWYQAATRKGKKGYRSLSGRWRDDAVYGFQITQAGNIVLNTVSWARLTDNLKTASRTKGAKEIWGDQGYIPMVADMETYLDNISAGRPGADSIGREKRDFINNLFGYRTAGQIDINPWHSKTKNPPPFFTTLRLDRMNQVQLLDSVPWTWGPSQNQDIKYNRRPETQTTKLPNTLTSKSPVLGDSGSIMNPVARETASKYFSDRFGSELEPHVGYEPLPVPRLQDLADFLETQEHSPDDPAVRASYEALKRETAEQYLAMVSAGVSIEPWDATKGEPYANSAEMVEDVVKNNHLWFFTTDNGFGETGIPDGHPLLENSGLEINGKDLVFNDLFRAVHDYFGHTQQGYQFGPRGEFNAWREHSKMFSSDAQGALAAETLAQNAWVNNGKHIRREDGTVPKKGDKDFIAPADRPFADQKAFIVPDEMITQFRPELELETIYAEKMGGGQARPETPEFKKWFGDSKVVDKDGNPLVVYHGTDADFESFDRKYLGQNTEEESKQVAKLGFWFNTTSPNDRQGNFPSVGSNVEAYLALSNPIELSFTGLFDISNADAFVEDLKAEGYDGIVTEDTEFGGTSYIAFEPTQIKSSVGNSGGFDGNDADIFRRPESVDAASLEKQFIGRDDSFWGITEDDDLGGASFSDTGRSAAECTGYACAIHKKLGVDRVEVFGFSDEENPTSSIAEAAGGHDFAVVDGRFIVDPWLTDVEGLGEKGVFDLENPEDIKLAEGFYGDSQKWNRATFSPQGVIESFQPVSLEPGYSEALDDRDPAQFRPITVDEISKKLKGGRGIKRYTVEADEPLQLTHYSRTAGITEIDPAKMSAKANVYSRMYRGTQKSFFYVGDSKPNAGENVNETFPYRYKAQIDGSKLYDFSKDGAGLWFSPNPEVMELGLKDAGYDGFYAETDDGRNFVALFKKMPVNGTEVIESEAAPGDIDGVADEEVETEADRKWAAWQKKQEAMQSQFANRGRTPRRGPGAQSRFRPETVNSDYTEVPSDTDIVDALSSDKKPFVGKHRTLEAGTPVGLRIDIPAFLRTGKYVVTVHEKAGANVGKRIGYDGVASVTKPTFFSNERGAKKILDGDSNKFPVATVEGEFNPSREIPSDIDEWTPVGYDPKDHSFFYDKKSGQPVVSGSEALSVGNTVFVKDPVYGKREDFLYRPETKTGSDISRRPETPVRADEAFLDAAVGDGMDNLRKKLSKRPGTGVGKNKFVVFSNKDGKRLSVGAEKKFGGRPFTSWIAETEDWLSDGEIAGFRKWYTVLNSEFVGIFGEEEAPVMMTAWLAAQQNVSPGGALGNVFKVEDRLAGIGTGKKGGLADAKIESVLTKTDLDKGVGAKLSDFVDAGFLKEVRTFMGKDVRGGAPFVADVHTGRDSGHVDQQTLTRLIKQAEQGNLFIDGAPVQVKATKTKKVKIKDKVQTVPQRVWITGGPKPFGLTVDLTGSPSNGTYEGISEWGNELSGHLNEIEWKGGEWNPSEVQAVGWMRTLRQYGLAEPTVEVALMQNTSRVYAEVNYSSGASLPIDFPGFGDLSREAQIKITRDVLNTIVPEIAGAIGGSLRIRDVAMGDGVFGGEKAPSIAASVLGSGDSVDLLAAALGLVSEQAATMSVRFGVGGKDSQGITVRKADGGRFTDEETASFLAHTELGGFSMHQFPGGSEILIVGSKSDYTPRGLTAKQASKTRGIIQGWVDANPVDLVAESHSLSVNAFSNDWSTNTQGQTYLQILESRGIGQKAGAVADLRERYREVLEEAFSRHAPEILGGVGRE
jgi:hypothetical protein